MRPVALAWILVAACGETVVDNPDVVSELSEPGPHEVGFSTFDVTYTPPLGGESRTLRALAWYPAVPTKTEVRPTYLLRTSEVAWQDAPPETGEARPVVIFSHGHQAYVAVMSHLMEHLASHGFIAIGPTHTGNTFVDGDNRETDIYYLRPKDISATLDALPDHAQQIGTASDRMLIIGHSFGGYTAYATLGAHFDVDTLATECADGNGPQGYCSTLTQDKEAIFRSGLTDDRLAAAIAIEAGDFGLFGAEGVRAVDRPSLHMTAERSEPDPYVPELTHATFLRLLGGDHNDFVDSCGYGVTIRCSELPPAEVRKAVEVYSLAFARNVLFSDETVLPILDGTQSVSQLLVPRN